ncbi:pickpocket protein 28-like [Pectinophora gossypiella]|uniref:pickpocket protein 28-like n=1 Tax=Pectinophora gossypiella TaxID=13191 RepID=UPI00214E2537|nr:pickpocket protein 28-like [Pectinophora gossypiella]
MNTDSVKRYVEIWIFWSVLVALSWYGSSLLIAAQYRAFQNNPISFVVETTYKDWNTHFPSVAICENDNTKRIEEISDGLWGPDHDFNMEEVLKEMAYFKGITYYTSEFCGLENPLPDCIKSNISYYATLVRSPCQDTLANCSWNEETFDCCKYFRPLDTELGTCFAINTIQGRDKNPPKYPMISNKTTGPGAIKFNVLVTANVYVLNEEEVPTLTTIGSDVLTVGPEVFHRRYITIRNVENDYGARLIAPRKRKCRYSDENSLQVYHHYSYTACTVQCRKDAQLRLCNCTNYFMPNVPERLKCDVEGIICLNDHVQELSVLKARWSSRPGLYCDCLPSCTEAEISIMKDFKVTTGENFATVQIELSMLPSERYRRNVVRGVLDLVVSTGGTCGLFLGVSILSFVELLYILLVRPFCDIYSQRDDDPWHRKFGTRRLQDNNFAPNLDWRYHRAKTHGNHFKRRQVHSNR